MFSGTAAANFTQPKAVSNDLALAKAACAKSYEGAKDQAICVRSAVAGESVTALFTELSGDAPSHFDTPDKSVVAATNDDHPASQCRLDTYLQGSLCNKPYTTDMSMTDPSVGGCVVSQGYKSGMRPFCWYKPAAGELIGQDEASIAASMEKQSHASSSPTLAALKSSNVFSGL
jgi:hypothetical protein